MMIDDFSEEVCSFVNNIKITHYNLVLSKQQAMTKSCFFPTPFSGGRLAARSFVSSSACMRDRDDTLSLAHRMCISGRKVKSTAAASPAMRSIHPSGDLRSFEFIFWRIGRWTTRYSRLRRRSCRASERASEQARVTQLTRGELLQLTRHAPLLNPFLPVCTDSEPGSERSSLRTANRGATATANAAFYSMTYSPRGKGDYRYFIVKCAFFPALILCMLRESHSAL